MNFGFENPALEFLPRKILKKYKCDLARLCKFNRNGSLIAIGFEDGSLGIFDYYSKSLIYRVRRLHEKNAFIHVLDWNKDGTHVAVGFEDGVVLIFDLKKLRVIFKHNFQTYLISLLFHPTYQNVLGISCNNRFPLLYNYELEEYCCIDCIKDLPDHVRELPKKRGKKREKEENKENELITIDNQKDEIILNNGKEISSLDKFTNDKYVLAFNPTNGNIFIGNTKGALIAVDYETLEILGNVPISDKFGVEVKKITFSEKHNLCAIMTTERILRVFDSSTLIQTHKLRSAVDKAIWRDICFSYDGKYMVGGSIGSRDHDIYIWKIEDGQNVWKLQGEPDMFFSLAVHPHYSSVIVSCGESGNIYEWGVETKQYHINAWHDHRSQLLENKEYEEREDEFDLNEKGERVADVRLIEEYKICGELGAVDCYTITDTDLSSSKVKPSFYPPPSITLKEQLFRNKTKGTWTIRKQSQEPPNNPFDGYKWLSLLNKRNRYTLSGKKALTKLKAKNASTTSQT